MTGDRLRHAATVSSIAAALAVAVLALVALVVGGPTAAVTAVRGLLP